MKTITIVEGPDGGGKSTLAERLAREQDAILIHSGPFRGVRHLTRIYANMLSPALLGDANVVLDRSWISEPIYGAVFRNGDDRVGDAGREELEELAHRACGVVILCMPPFEACLAAYQARMPIEIRRHPHTAVQDAEQLHNIYHFYDVVPTTLPIERYDYTAQHEVHP